MEGGHRGLKSMEPEESQILNLKKEMKALMDRRREEWALEDRMARLVAQPTVAGEDRAAAEAEAPKKERKTVVIKSMVPQGVIDYMITNPNISFRRETLPNRPQKFRERYAKRKAISYKNSEYDLALIKQYVTKGYAEDYTEATDDEDEDI
ncbi:unnamed protein product [Urochloa decumbens]|uniref:Uncharacterized protein n=1 Tax=Urochloa decumbens TaxID=240449 RepID=A0ABC9EDM7_9POAL